MEDNFSNIPVAVADLPRIEEEHFEKLNTEYRSLIVVARILLFTFLAAIGVFVYFASDLELWHIYLPWLLVASSNIVVAWFGFKKKGYLLRERDISYRSGLIFHHLTTVPLVRIQHSEVSQGPLQRLFDLATVKIYTAGGSTSDLSIPGLSPEDANKIRDFINQTVHENVST